MMYHESLWAQAPEGATHWILVGKTQRWVKMIVEEQGTWAYNYFDPENGLWDNIACTSWKPEIHPRPEAYRTAAQLIEAYLKEHGAEIEADVQRVTEGTEPIWTLEERVDRVAFDIALIEYVLAAERKRIEESQP